MRASIEENIEEIREEPESLAEEFGGEYDGWGAPGQRMPIQKFGHLHSVMRSMRMLLWKLIFFVVFRVRSERSP